MAVRSEPPPRRPPPDPASRPEERPAHRVRWPAFLIARYPVTVAQWRVYAKAVESGAWTPRRPDAEPCEGLDPRSVDGVPTCPVVHVSWYDALDYCAWLTTRLREWPGTPEPLANLLRRGPEGESPWVVTLPSEAEWEKGARGDDGRRYPWGDAFDSNRVNAWGEGAAIRTRSAVGCFPGGASPSGIEETSGNVWEWTRSLWGVDAYPYRRGSGRESLSAGPHIPRVIRGGASIEFPRNVRSAFRYGVQPRNRFDAFGFRVTVSALL